MLENTVAKLKHDEGEVEETVYDLMVSMDLTSVKHSEFGTVSRSLYMLPYIKSESTFMEWIRSTNNYQFLQDRVKLTELRQYIRNQEALFNPEAVPPGVEIKNDKRISVRSPKGGKDDD
jgi:hypothetical protein